MRNTSICLRVLISLVIDALLLTTSDHYFKFYDI